MVVKKRLVMRDYQEKIVSDIIQNFNINKPYVLGSSPSSGKTEMAIETIIRLLNLNLVKKTLVLAHSTNVLKDNFYSRLFEYFHDSGDITVMAKGKVFDKNAAIQVMIPQNIKHIEGQFDLIIVDEAHHNVLADDGNYSKIVERVQPKFQLLLTGTPSKFIRENDIVLSNNTKNNTNDELPYYINCVGMDMVGFEHFHDVKFDLIRSAYGFTNNDYDNNDNISSNTHFSFEETQNTINNVIIGAVRNIALRNGLNLPRNADFVEEGKRLIQQKMFGKTLFMCRNIEQANQVQQIVSKLFKVKVGVSESKTDTDSVQLKRFKNDEFDFLCVVNRAREGYDDKKIVNLIDITMTHNIDLIYQMLCREVRKDNSYQKPKLYLKVTSNAEGMPDYTLNIMTAALMLASTENLEKFNGSNFRNIVMPRVETEPDGDEDNNVTVNGVVDIVDGNGNRVTRRRLSELMVLDLVRMFVDDHENLINGNDRYAMTTLGDALDIMDGRNYVRDKQVYFDLLRREDIAGSGVWLNRYKELSERDGLIYHSTPWTIFNQTIKEFFDECCGDREILYVSDKEVYFELIRRENITGNVVWRKRYKEFSERDGENYHSNPWTFFNQTTKEFFDECYGDRSSVSDKQVYFELLKRENITGSHVWSKRYKELSERDEKKYHSQPWRLFNQTEKEFFDECCGDREIIYVSDKEVYFDLFRRENITGSHGWSKRYKELSERDGEKYHSNPWTFFNQTTKEFFDEYREWSNTNQPKKSFRKAYLGKFSEMNKEWNTTNSVSIHEKLKKNPKSWHEYHKLYSEARKKWDEIPYIEIAKKINGRPEWVVGDFGCGENLLKNEIANKIHSFDHIAIDDSVVSCDLACIPLNNEVLDVVVFSLALMHTNYDEYLKEAYRVLKPMGLVFISEPRQRWSDEEGNLDKERINKLSNDNNFKLAGDVKTTDKFIYFDMIKIN